MPANMLPSACVDAVVLRHHQDHVSTKDLCATPAVAGPAVACLPLSELVYGLRLNILDTMYSIAEIKFSDS